jgi:hypothetical protein
LKVAPVFKKMRSIRLAWHGHVMRRDERHITKTVMTMLMGALVEVGLGKDGWIV